MIIDYQLQSRDVAVGTIGEITNFPCYEGPKQAPGEPASRPMAR